MSSVEEVKHLHIPLQELSDATNGFSDQNIIARGGFGKVYRGVSVKHGHMAIKMLDPQLGQGVHEFKTEIALLSVYKHENIVSLLGFCDEEGQKILVYNYESNGSLDKHLSSTDLTWIQRLQICLDAANGLQYLHHDVEPQSRILHRDVKSSNILLDENWKAKISDFGLSRIGPANIESTFLISNPCGTYGYIDPEYTTTGYLTQKSDVYSFGVVLFEVLCGRLARVMAYKDERQFLTNLITIHWKNNTLDEIIYSDLQRQINKASLVTFSRIAYQCLKSGNERPTMKKVVEQLQKALDNQIAPMGLRLDDNHGFAAHHHQGQSAGPLESSSQSFLSSSSSQSWKYDVFISFRAEDTHMAFVNHLYSALVRRLIFPYKDDETRPQNESIGPSHLKAIQESQIAIIMFSKYYAWSSWCLDELIFIMKNREERGQIVIPIFYDVKPSDVRRQTGYYGEAFHKHELNDNKNKVESWRKALRNVTDIAGWDADYGNESKDIPRLVDRISYELLSLMERYEASAETSSDTYLIGIETRVQELKSLLEVGSGDVRMVGVYGMWGSGKSTLASYIYDEISHEFEGCCFVKDVTARSTMHGLKTLQEEILSNVLKLKVTLTNIEQGKHMMKSLCQNSVLIVLDDVYHTVHLEMLVGSHNWFGNGSRIIFTTRNQDLAKARGFLPCNVLMLEPKEAIELFSRHAFGKSRPLPGFEDVSLIMVSKFGGHPSALISLGSFLHGKDRSVWMRILDILVCKPVDEILKKFETPDDGLARNIWLDFLLRGSESCLLDNLDGLRVEYGLENGLNN